jgi:hypothetical protein
VLIALVAVFGACLTLPLEEVLTCTTTDMVAIPPLLIMNLISGLCTLYVGVLATSQYYQPFVEAETAWERVSASAAIVLYASVAVYGVA